MQHALVIGGTGMLSGVTVELAKRTQHMTLISRRASAFVERSGFVRTVGIDADWSDARGFLAEYVQRVTRVGETDFALLWMHSSAHRTFDMVLDALDGYPCEVVHVVGSQPDSSRLDPSRVRERLLGSTIRYRTARLGCRVEPSGTRWLTHEEICTGVLECIQTGQDLVVGDRVPDS